MKRRNGVRSGLIKPCVFLIRSVALLLAIAVDCETSTEAVANWYQFQGQGEVYGGGGQGVIGESVSLTFNYNSLGFQTYSYFGGWFTVWKADAPIPVKAIGSISGTSFQLHPVRYVQASASQQKAVWQFTTGTAAATMYSLAEVWSPAKNSALSQDVPADFSLAHQTLVNELALGDVWVHSLHAGVSGVWENDDIILVPPLNTKNLSLSNFHWQIVEIPEPTAFLLAVPAMAGIAVRRRSHVR
jgi:hypothetical protein